MIRLLSWPATGRASEEVETGKVDEPVISEKVEATEVEHSGSGRAGKFLNRPWTEFDSASAQRRLDTRHRALDTRAMGAPIDHFKYCPQCAAALPEEPRRNPLRCPRCEFTYYFNPAVAAAAFVEDAGGQVLLLRRAKEPARGKLSLPGGFVDFCETAEDGLRREMREEVGLELGELTFLCSQVNQYTFRQITYPVLDLFFVGHSESTAARPLDGAESVGWFDPVRVEMAELSFPSVQAAWLVFLARRHRA